MYFTLSLPNLPPQHLAQLHTHITQAHSHTHARTHTDTVSAHRSVGKVWRADFQRSAKASDRKLVKYAGYFSVTWTEFMIRSSAPVSSCLAVKGAILPATCTAQFRSVALGVCRRATSGRGHSIWHKTGHRVRQASGIKEATSGSREKVWKVYFLKGFVFYLSVCCRVRHHHEWSAAFPDVDGFIVGDFDGRVREGSGLHRQSDEGQHQERRWGVFSVSVCRCVCCYCVQCLCLFCWNCLCGIKWPPCRKVSVQIYKWVLVLYLSIFHYLVFYTLFWKGNIVL